MCRKYAVRIHRVVPFLLMYLGLFLLSFVMLPDTTALAQSVSQSPNLVQQSSSVQQSQRQAERREQIAQSEIDNPEAEDGENVYRHSAMVHTLARTFGLSVENTSRTFETINFLILVAVIVWFLVRSLPATLRRRAERIQTQLREARAISDEASRRMAGVEERLARLDGEIHAIRMQAQQEAHEKEKQMLAALEQEKRLILAASAQEIAAASNRAQNQLKRLTAELAIERARHRMTLTSDADRSLVTTFLTDLDQNRPKDEVN